MIFDVNLNTGITLAVLGVTCYNTYAHTKIKNTVLELQINLKREFNGRYQSLAGGQDSTKRIERLEDLEMKSHKE